jgi:hypothetical protein
VPDVTSPFRNLPAVDALVRDVEQRLNGDALPHDVLVTLARAAIDEARRSRRRAPVGGVAGERCRR